MSKLSKTITTVCALALSVAPAFASKANLVAGVVDNFVFPNGDQNAVYTSKPYPGYVLTTNGDHKTCSAGVNIPAANTGNYINSVNFTSLQTYYISNKNADKYLQAAVQTSDGYYYVGNAVSNNISGNTWLWTAFASNVGLPSGEANVVLAAIGFEGGDDVKLNTIQTYGYTVNGSNTLSSWKYSTLADHIYNVDVNGTYSGY